MRYSLPILILLVLFSFAVPVKTTIKQFSWLEGEWTAQQGKNKVVEEWRISTDTTLMGQCKFVH